MLLNYVRDKNNCITVSEALGVSTGLLKLMTVKTSTLWNPPDGVRAWIKLNTLDLSDLKNIKCSFSGEWKSAEVHISKNNIDWELLETIERGPLVSNEFTGNYKNKEFVFLKVTFYEIKNFKFQELVVEGEETYENDNFISILYQQFYEPKMIEFYPFFPNLLKTFFKMLETNHNEDYRIIPADFRIGVEEDEITYLSGSINEQMLNETTISSLD